MIVKILFLPLANKSYASMAKMKAVQPEMAAIASYDKPLRRTGDVRAGTLI